MQPQHTVHRPCDQCGKIFASVFFIGRASKNTCPTCSEDIEKQREINRAKLRELSLTREYTDWLTSSQRGIPPRYQSLLWDDFKFDNGGEDNITKVNAIRDYALNFPVLKPPTNTQSLLITSETNGVGKTMLLCLILMTIISRYFDENEAHIQGRRREVSPFQFWTVPAMKRRLRAAERYHSAETTDDVVNDFSTMWLLALDDVGQEKVNGADSDYNHDMYFSVINARYSNGLPLLMTSNLGINPWYEEGPSLVDIMGRASVSRLMEMTQGVQYTIVGHDRR